MNKIELLREVNEILLTENRGYSISFKEVRKNNQVLDAIAFEGLPISPIFYYEPHLLEEEPRILADVVCDFFDEYCGVAAGYMDHFSTIDGPYILSHVYPKLVAREGNEEWISSDDLFCSEFLDMYALYYVVVPPFNDMERAMSSFTLHNSHVRSYDILPRTLQRASKNNFRKTFEMKSMFDVIKDSTGLDLTNDEIPMYILTNETKLYGAAAILDDEILDTVSEELGDDLIVLPSSTHEVIVIPAGCYGDLSACLEMVREVNATSVAPTDRLTNSVYIYDGALRKWNGNGN